MGKVRFTQYLLPEGKTKTIYIQRPDNISDMANVLLLHEIALDAEVLSTGEVSLSAHDPKTDKTLAIEIVPNNQDIGNVVDRLISQAFLKFNLQSPDDSGKMISKLIELADKAAKKEFGVDIFKTYDDDIISDDEEYHLKRVIAAFKTLIKNLIAVEVYPNEIVVSGIVWDLHPDNDVVDEASQFHQVWKYWTKITKEQFNLKGSWDYFKEKNVLFFKIRRNRS